MSGFHAKPLDRSGAYATVGVADVVAATVATLSTADPADAILGAIDVALLVGAGAALVKLDSNTAQITEDRKRLMAKFGEACSAWVVCRGCVGF